MHESIILENFLLGIGQGDPRSAVLCFLIKSDIGHKQWKRYLDHHSGRHNFQIDLALSIINYGISLQWDGASAKRTKFMWQDPFVPCNCGKCFFA